MEQIAVPVAEGLFDYDEQTKTASLIIAECKKCKHTAFPKIEFCPECAEATMEQVHLNSEGKLVCFTEISAPPPGYKGEIPYTVGIVEFPEKNIKILGLLSVDDHSSLMTGEPMKIVVERSYVEEGIPNITYKFQPID